MSYTDGSRFQQSNAFQPGSTRIHEQYRLDRRIAPLYAEESKPLSASETSALEFLNGICSTGFSFRVVVVGQTGAILETTTPCLGPITKVSQSPVTGANLVTFASEDQSFEFHVQLGQVHSFVLVERETPKKTMRILRMMNSDKQSMASLILTDTSDAATAWFQKLIETHGSELQVSSS